MTSTTNGTHGAGTGAPVEQGLARLTTKRPKAMIFVPGKGAFSGAVDVYRAANGIGIVVVGEGTAVRQTPHGPVRVSGRVTVEFPSDAAFDAAKRLAFHKNPAQYTKLVGVLGIDDDARHAPRLPAAVRFADEVPVVPLEAPAPMTLPPGYDNEPSTPSAPAEPRTGPRYRRTLDDLLDDEG